MVMLDALAGLIFVIRIVTPISLTRTPHQPQRNNHENISTLLDNLLRGYDNSIRPDFGGVYRIFYKRLDIQKFNFTGPPAVVEVDIMVRSMGPISEVDMVRKCENYIIVNQCITHV